MLYSVPTLAAADQEVLAQAIRGSNSIEGYQVSVDDAAAGALLDVATQIGGPTALRDPYGRRTPSA